VRTLTALTLALVLALLPATLLIPGAAVAGPVSWQEVPASAEGRQWWDAGSLRLGREGRLSVLSRFQPADGRSGQLYVMEIDCDQRLYRDTSVNGLPRFRAEWQPEGGDPLITATLDAVCTAGTPLLASR
jgi:hypothetical protein